MAIVSGVTLPREALDELKWRKGQKLVLKKRGKGILISDWGKQGMELKLKNFFCERLLFFVIVNCGRDFLILNFNFCLDDNRTFL